MTFEEIYKDYWQKVFRLCMGYVNDHEWAKDIAQETFIIVWQQLPKFRNESSIGTWVFRIASNNCLRQIERQNRMRKSDLAVELPAPSIINIESKMAYLYKCISTLQESDRIIISLELEGVDQNQIASVVGLSEGNVRVRIHRIKEKLQQQFSKYEQ